MQNQIIENTLEEVTKALKAEGFFCKIHDDDKLMISEGGKKAVIVEEYDDYFLIKYYNKQLGTTVFHQDTVEQTVRSVISFFDEE